MQIQSGVNAARSDDAKGIKHAIIVWIADPEKGLVPPIDPAYMSSRGWNHPVTGRELCPAGLDWDDKTYVGLSTALTHGSRTST